MAPVAPVTCVGPVGDVGSDGPLGSRQYRSPRFGLAFARGLEAGGVAACAKHFPGLGPLAASTDDRLYVRARLRQADLAPYREAIAAGIPCVMVGHGIYRNVGPRRATLEPAAIIASSNNTAARRPAMRGLRRHQLRVRSMAPTGRA